MNPKITVLMSVYNGEKYLHEAIDSILNQTYKNFEFLIMNDASTDSSREIILSYDDPRIILVDNERNLGLASSLNKGIYLAKGEYIARMDADDISLSHRLQTQVDFMDNHPETGICGSGIKCFGNSEELIKFSTNYEINYTLLFHNQLAHATVIMRKSLLEKFKLKYDENILYAQDYELWTRCLELFQIVNLPDVLLLYRVHSSGASVAKFTSQMNIANEIRKKMLERIGIYPTSEELAIHNAISNRIYEYNHIFLKKMEDWLLKLKKYNEIEKIIDISSFNQLLETMWIAACKDMAKYNAASLNDLLKSSLNNNISVREKLKFLFIMFLGKINYYKIYHYYNGGNHVKKFI